MRQITGGRLLRSYLFAPGDNERLLAKVLTAGADAVVLDLEDAVSADRKALARERVLKTLLESPPEPPIWVRLNDLRGDEWRADLGTICSDPAATRRLAGLRVPKAESLRELQRLDEALRPVERKAGLQPESLSITCTIETAAGVATADRLAAQPRVRHLSFGEADFAADIGAELDPEFTATLFARSSLVITARAANIAPPIAPVYTLLDDEEGLRRTTLQARHLGFFGRSCIHPKQIPIIHDVFTPTAAQISEARRILEIYDQAKSAVAIADGGRFVDAAVARHARALLELAPNGEGV